MTTKTGRNDLCPCGSGKKYKKCCIVLENIIDPEEDLFTRYNNILSVTKIKLEQAYAQPIKKIRNEAKDLFLRFTPDRILTSEYESLFSDWLWLDKTDSEENTLAFHYLQTHGEYMDDSLRTCLSSLTLSYLSIYEVVGMENQLLKVKDIFTDLEVGVLVKEPFDSPQSLLLGRLVHMPEASIFSGTVLLMTNEDDRQEFIINHFNYLKSLSTDTYLNLFKFQGHIILGLFAHAYKKVMVNLNDIRYAPLNQEDSKKLVTAWQSNENFSPVHNLEGYQWFTPVYSDRGYVRIAIGEENIILSADVLDDVDYLQEQVKSLLPTLDFTIINSIFLNQPPSLAHSDIWLAIIKDQESEKWLNTPVNELEGRTPNEVLKEDGGKNYLLKILNNLEDSVATEEQQDFIVYLKERIEN